MVGDSGIARKVLREAGVKAGSGAWRELLDMLDLGVRQLRKRAKERGIQRIAVETVWLAAWELPVNESAICRTKRELCLSDHTAGLLLSQVRDAATAVLVERAGVARLNRLVELQQPPASLSNATSARSDQVASSDAATTAGTDRLPLTAPLLAAAKTSADKPVEELPGEDCADDKPARPVVAAAAPRIKLWFPEPSGEPERASSVAGADDAARVGAAHA
jgi:hypothetical protein